MQQEIWRLSKMAKTVTHIIDGQPYEVPEGFSELDVRDALRRQSSAANPFAKLGGVPKVTGKREKDIMPSGFGGEFGYGVKRKLRESLGGLKEFATGKPSLPLEADIPTPTSQQFARGAGKHITRVAEGLSESLLGAKIGGRLGPVGAVVGGIAAPFIAGYLKQPGPRISGERLLSAGEEALPGAAKLGAKELSYGIKLARALKPLEAKVTEAETAKTAANRYLTSTQEGIPPAAGTRTSVRMGEKEARAREKMPALQEKQAKLQEAIDRDAPFKSIQFDEKGPALVDLTKLKELKLPNNVKAGIVKQNKEQFINEASDSFDPKIDYDKLAAEEHNKIYDNISAQVTNKYNDVLEGEPESIPATNTGYKKFRQVAQAVGEEIAPLQKLFPDNVEVLNPEEQQLVPELQKTKDLKNIPTKKILSFYKTAKQIAYKLSSKAWQESNNLVDVQRTNLDTASEKYNLLANRLKNVLNEVNPEILEKLSDADDYFAKNKAPFYARPEHWQAQNKGKITTDILRDTHAAKNVPEAGFLRNLIRANEGYRRAALGKLFGRNIDKLAKEGEFEEYADFVKSDPHVSRIHKTLQEFENIEKQMARQKEINEPMAKATTEQIKTLLEAKNQLSKNLAKDLSTKYETIKSLVLKKQQGLQTNTEELIKVGKDIKKLEEDIEAFEAYKNNLADAEKKAAQAGYDLEEIKTQANKARKELADYKQKYKKLAKLAKTTLAGVAAKLYLFK